MNNIICESCGSKGKALYSPMTGDSAVPVFRHLGHDIRTADMRYRCLHCGAILLVDPMLMLSEQDVRGIPSGSEGWDVRLE